MQMYTHELNPTKGWPSPAALDKRGVLDVATDAVGTVYAGMCIHKSPAASGSFRLGLPAASKSAGTAPMPVFVFQNATDFDVTIDATGIFGNNSTQNIVGMSASDAGSTTPVSQKPVLGGLVATGGYELQTTEFTGTPTTGQVLTSLTSSADPTNCGKIAVATTGSTITAGTILCGVVSDGVVSNDHVGGPNLLQFWPIYDVVWTTPT
jgi:hypothetical protein